MKRITVLLLLCISLSGCKLHKGKELNQVFIEGDTLCVNTEYFNKLSDHQLKRLFIQTGNPYVYALIFSHCSKEQRFIYSLIMGNKFGRKSYLIDAFQTYEPNYPTLKGHESEALMDFNALDEISRQQALGFLKESAESKMFIAEERLGSYYLYGNGVKKDTQLGNELLIKAVSGSDSTTDRGVESISSKGDFLKFKLY
ncbi:SEL1-like repeat protein [Paludibacter sp.]|uniref:SEL1-like repeat protein n=1 Tax=Paludibacter sp. TaxID=1898105 RepID=UPI0013522545|nr:SEL1-like repeat protein [Paludibacter sp.]MTK53911.1 SEL1-like repeat protein [Paludibacter sp.]